MKFKVGETVKIKENLEVDEVYEGVYLVLGMEKYRGKQAKITRMRRKSYDLDIDNGKYAWTDVMLESIPSEKYEVIVEGNTVTVKDDKGNTGIAKCSPEDELSTAISTAIRRLKWKPSSGEKYYSICFADKNFVTQYNWADDSTDNTLYERGLVFKTIEEAEEAAKIMLDSIRKK